MWKYIGFLHVCRCVDQRATSCVGSHRVLARRCRPSVVIHISLRFSPLPFDACNGIHLTAISVGFCLPLSRKTSPSTTCVSRLKIRLISLSWMEVYVQMMPRTTYRQPPTAWLIEPRYFNVEGRHGLVFHRATIRLTKPAVAVGQSSPGV